jgi:hypothetical protein
MKKLLLFLLLVPLVSFGQIIKVKKPPKPIVIGVADKMVGYPKLSNLPGTDIYLIYYRNLEYEVSFFNVLVYTPFTIYTAFEDFKSFTFNATKEELEYLYNALLEPLLTKDKSPKSITVGDVTLNYKKTMSSISVFVDHPNGITDGWMGYLSKKQLARLFGKK